MKQSLRRAVLRALRAQRVQQRGGSVLFLLYPLRVAASALSLALLFGCIATVATHQDTKDAVALQAYENNYDALEATYAGRCATKGDVNHEALTPCVDAWKAIRTYEKDIKAAAHALQFGGAMPMQLDALKVDDAVVKKAVAALPLPIRRQGGTP